MSVGFNSSSQQGESHSSVGASLNKEEVGANLKRARKAAGLTQEEAAERLNIHTATYQKWETGERISTWPRLALAAKILETSPNELLGYDEPTALERAIRDRLDPELLGHALQAVSDLAERNIGTQEQRSEGALENDQFWTVMGRAFADIIALTLSGASAREAVLYLRGFDRGFRNQERPPVASE